MQQNQLVTIAGINISQDAQGRYRLNDLHQAAGGEERHTPKYWVALVQTQELIAELNSDGGIPPSEQNQALTTIKGGNEVQGTFVSKELVYAYAMWVAPRFHIAVIRAYDALVTKPVAPQPTAPLRLSVHLRDGLRDDEWDVLYETMHDIAGTSELFFNAIYSQFVRKFKHHVPYNEALRYLREVRIDYCSGFTPYYRGGVLVV